MKATFEPLTRAEIHAHAVSNHEDENPSIYLGTYRKYNSGDLFGMWIDLTTFANYDEFCDFCTSVHYDELDPEFMVQDFCNYPRKACQWGHTPLDSPTSRISYKAYQ